MEGGIGFAQVIKDTNHHQTREKIGENLKDIVAQEHTLCPKNLVNNYHIEGCDYYFSTLFLSF